MTKPATLVRQYDDTHLRCRGLERHWWETTHEHDEDFRPAPWGVRVVQRCANCVSFRHALFNPKTGEFIKGSHWAYRMAEGYAISGQGRIPPVVFRAETFRREFTFAKPKSSKPKLTVKQGGAQTSKKVTRRKKAA